MRRRPRAAQIDVERLNSRAVADWLTPAERARVGELVDAARAVWAVDPHARTDVDALAPGARYPAALLADRARAVEVVELLVVEHRRRLAGREYARASGEPVPTVAARFRLGHLALDEEDRYLATAPLAG